MRAPRLVTPQLEQDGQALGGVLVVINNQNPELLQVRAGAAPIGDGSTGCACARITRQAHDKLASAVDAFAVRCNGPAMQFDDLLH